MRQRTQCVFAHRFAAPQEGATQAIQPTEIEPARTQVAEFFVPITRRVPLNTQNSCVQQCVGHGVTRIERVVSDQEECLLLLEVARPKQALDSHPPCKCPPSR